MVLVAEHEQEKGAEGRKKRRRRTGSATLRNSGGSDGGTGGGDYSRRSMYTRSPHFYIVFFGPMLYTRAGLLIQDLLS